MKGKRAPDERFVPQSVSAPKMYIYITGMINTTYGSISTQNGMSVIKSGVGISDVGTSKQKWSISNVFEF